MGGLAMLVLAGCAGWSMKANAPITLEADSSGLVIFTGASRWGASAGSGKATTLESPPIRTVVPWNELVVSWNVEPAQGAGLVVEALPETPSGSPYRMGEWSLGEGSPRPRTSIRGQKDSLGVVKTDTLVLKQPVSGLRLRVTLEGTLAEHPERLRWVTVSMTDTTRIPEPRTARREVWGRRLAVPERSQLAYPGGETWCSPTSVSMVLGWWAGVMERPDLDRDVPEVAEGVHDPGWSGTGNWPFNTAYAGSLPGLRGCAARLRDLRDVEDLVAEGVPVVMSVHPPALRGRGVAPDAGHLIVCTGFTETGDVEANDPWARLEEGQTVHRVYARANVERAWEHAHRLAYLIAPEKVARRFPAVWR